MNRTIASLTQWVGRLTVVVALVFLIWGVAELAGEPEGAGIRPSFGPNQYLQLLASASSIAVSGMLAVGIGMMLQRFDDE